jgi:DNA-binding XRE family transcriptional regulator
MDIFELKKELKRLKREQRDAYSKLVQTAQLRFKWAREACNLTQEKLAAILRVNRGTIIKSENINRGDLESGRVETLVNNYILLFSKEYKTDWKEFLTISQSKDWKKSAFQILISTNKNVDLVKSFISERDRGQLQSKEIETLPKNRIGLDPRQTIQQVFIPLSTIFQKKRDFFPSEKLFIRDLIFFTRPEHEYINKIEKHFQKKNSDNFFLVIGGVATGKTVMAIYIAEKLREKGYRTLYYKLNAKTSYDKLHLSFAAQQSTNTFFIIDDCHKNIDVASEIYDRFNQIKDFYCLLCTRPVPKYVRRLSSLDYQDIFSDFAKKDKVFSLNKVDVRAKMFGIIEKYKQYLEKEKGFKAIVDDKNQIIKNVKRNYLMLYFYLSYWTPNEPLDKLNETQILEKMYERYINNATNEPYKDLILKYAALYQYGIEFEPSKKDEDKAKKLVNPIAILERDEDTDYYSFYHSNFARLLLESFATRDKFSQRYKNGIEEFTLEQLKAFFADFEKYPNNLPEVFFNLFQNNEIYLLSLLLQDSYIKRQSISFFLNESRDAYSLVRFLSIINNVVPKQAKMFCRCLIFENIEIKSLFATGFNPIHTFAFAINLLFTIDDEYPTLFLNKFKLIELRQILLTSSFGSISRSLHQLSKNIVTKQTANTFLKNVTIEELSEKAKELSFSQTGDALNCFKNLDVAKAQKIFNNIDPADLAKKAKEASFSQICSSLYHLVNLDKVKAQEIFENIDLAQLTEKAKVVNLNQLGIALIGLKNIDEAKAQKIFENMGLARLAEKAKKASFVQMGKTLSDLKNVDEAKAQKIFKKIGLAVFLPK